MTTPASILVVDDDEDTCSNLSDILTDLGYRVGVAHDGLAALEHARRHPYNFALLDLRMPGMDGIEVCRALRGLRAETVVVVVTAYVDREGRQQALAAGAYRVLEKPLDFVSLLGLLREGAGPGSAR
jgi:CheY-like chemotaxis protein